MKQLFLILLLAAGMGSAAQYAPQAGLPGSTAISASSSLFVGWATQCAVQRGFMNIANPSLGYASAGDSSLAVGPADDETVSLGDSGVAVLTFELPICNGPGPDFAVFENGFLNPANDSQAFLELGFVEVSSDGVHYFRFPATSLTQDKTQISNDDYIYAGNLNNLAGSYVALYGTPFDLSDMTGIAGLDVNNVTHVRVVDVVGSISGHSGYDSAGRIVNDPYPTPFPSCGFDLDAVGVINRTGNAGIAQLNGQLQVTTFPNPVTEMLNVTAPGTKTLFIALTDVTGRQLQAFSANDSRAQVDMCGLAAGLYCIKVQDSNGGKWVGKVVKR